MNETRPNSLPRSTSQRRWKVSRLLALLLILAFPTVAGVITYVGLVRDNEGGVDGLQGVVTLAISRDGAHLYAAGYGEGSIAAFSRDVEDGSLQFLEVYQNGVGGVVGMADPVSVDVSPDGRHVFAANTDNDSLIVFRRDPSTGLLTYVDTYIDGVDGIWGLDGANDVAVTPDDRYVLVTARTSSTLVLFSRDATLDDLDFVDIEIDGEQSVEMRGPYTVTVSPDSAYAYVAASLDNHVSVFSLDGTQGDVAAIDSTVDDIQFIGTIPTFESPRDVAFDRTGTSAYLVGGNWLSAGSRDPSSGAITLLWDFVDGLGGIDGIEGAEAVVVTRVGDKTVVTGSIEDAVTSFARDDTDGSLQLEMVFRQGVGGVDGIEIPARMAVSPDSRFLYVAGYLSNAIAIFEIEIENLLLTDGFETGDTQAWSDSTEVE